MWIFGLQVFYINLVQLNFGQLVEDFKFVREVVICVNLRLMSVVVLDQL